MPASLDPPGPAVASRSTRRIFRSPHRWIRKAAKSIDRAQRSVMVVTRMVMVGFLPGLNEVMKRAWSSEAKVLKVMDFSSSKNEM